MLLPSTMNIPFLYKRRAAFTLVELLVVIAIIAVLAGLVMAGMSKSRTTANSIKSVSNLKSLYTAHLNYFNDNGAFPSDSDWDNYGLPEQGTQAKTWHERISTYVGLGTTIPEALKQFKIGQLPPGVFQVPGRLRQVENNGGSGGGFRSGYIRNSQIYQNKDSVNPSPNSNKTRTSFTSLITFQALSSTHFLIDIGGESAANDYNGWQIGVAERLKWPAFGGKTNTLTGTINTCFMDGHVESRQKKDIPSDWQNIFWRVPTS